MKILQVSVAALALVGFASFASAAGRTSALPTVAKDVRANAKAAGILTGMKSPKFELDYSKSGKSVRVTLSALSTFNGGPTPLKVAQRMPEYTAQFRIKQGRDGKVVTPVKVGGRVWEGMMR